MGYSYVENEGKMLETVTMKPREATNSKKKKRRKKKHTGNRVLKIFGILTALIASIAAVLCLAFVVLYKSGEASLANAVEKKAPTAEGFDEEEALLAKEKAGLATVTWQDDWVALDGKAYEYDENIINLLFLGIDRAGSISTETNLDNWKAGQADAIFILSLNPDKKTIRIVGIPRNSMVDVDIYDQNARQMETIHNQICLQYGYAGGGENGLHAMKDAASKLMYDLPIHGAFAIGYDAVSIINDKVGGVDVEVLEDMPEKNKAFVLGNTVHLDGKLALQYVRERDYYQLGSPTLRLKRQKQYITALIQAAKTCVKQDPLLVTDLYNSITKYMNTDVTVDEAVYLVRQALDYQFDGDSFYLLQGDDVSVPFTRKDGTEDFYDDYYLREDSIRQVMIDAFYNEVKIDEDGR